MYGWFQLLYSLLKLSATELTVCIRTFNAIFYTAQITIPISPDFLKSVDLQEEEVTIVTQLRHELTSYFSNLSLTIPSWSFNIPVLTTWSPRRTSCRDAVGAAGVFIPIIAFWKSWADRAGVALNIVSWKLRFTNRLTVRSMLLQREQLLCSD